MLKEDSCLVYREDKFRAAVFMIVRARPCFTLWSFSLIRKTELWKTNKPPAVQVVEVASAYSIKPPVL